MAQGLNQVMLVGNLGKDPELKDAGSTKVCNLRLATTHSYIDKNKDKKESTQWHNVVVWGARGEAVAKYCKKGSRLFVRGRIEYREHDGKYYTDIVCEDFLFLDGKSDSGGGGSSDNIPY